MIAPARACEREAPFPHVMETLFLWADGLTQEYTGMPMRSRPVMSAMRVTPILERSGSIRRQVALALTVR
jgi:hypothetical protein